MLETYPPPPEAIKHAHIKGMEAYREMYEQSISDPDTFWSDAAKIITWKKNWTPPVCEYAWLAQIYIKECATCLSPCCSRYNFDLRKGSVFAKWFPEGTTNACYNALDRHVEAGLGEKIAFYYEGNDSSIAGQVTFQQLLDLTCRISNYMKSIGIGKGDDVTIYMPMVPELPAAMVSRVPCVVLTVHCTVAIAVQSKCPDGEAGFDACGRLLQTSRVNKG
jgi:acetyl-CoA synthetase